MSLSAQVCMEANNNELKTESQCHDEAVLVKLLEEETSEFTSHSQLQGPVSSDEKCGTYGSNIKSCDDHQTERKLSSTKPVEVP